MLAGLASRLWAADVPPLDAAGLMAKYTENQEKLKSFAMVIDCTSTASSTWINRDKQQDEPPLHYSWILRWDGNRICLRSDQWGRIAEQLNPTKERPLHSSCLWDGEFYYDYNYLEKPNGSVNRLSIDHPALKPGEFARNSGLPQSGAAPFLGFFADDSKRVDEVLRQAKITSVPRQVRPEGQDHDLIRIEAKTPAGRYTLWLDADRGYTIALAWIDRMEGDIDGGSPMQADTNRNFRYQAIDSKKVGDAWIVTEAEIEDFRRYPLGGSASTRGRRRVTGLEINPDHDAKGYFRPDDIKDGAEIMAIWKPDFQAVWKNGKPFPALPPGPNPPASKPAP